MYLLVFVTLVISLIGLYGQVLSLQAARLAQGQAVVAQAMLRWHETAIQQARTTNLPIPTAGGCDLNLAGIVGTTCVGANGNVYVSAANPPPAPWPACAGASVPPYCWNPLPAGYQTAPYTFYSVYYTVATGQHYVVTFVPKPAGNPGFITLPGAAGTPISITTGDLMNQIRNSGLNPMNYGTISGGQLTTQPITFTAGGPLTPISYAMPAAVTNGSIGIISAP